MDHLIGIPISRPTAKQKHGTFTRSVFFAPEVTENEFLTVLVAELPPGTKGPVHLHAGEEVVYTLKGVLEIEIEGRTYRMEPGSFSLIPSRTKHPATVVSEEPWVGICVFCDQCQVIKKYTDLRFETDGEMGYKEGAKTN